MALGRWCFAASIIALILTNQFGYHSKFASNENEIRNFSSIFQPDRVTRFLSGKFFAHISKLEYAIYLLNPLVVTVLCGFAGTSHNLDYASIYTLGFAVVILSYMFAVLFAVLFELPISRLVNSLFVKNEKTS